MSQESTRPRLHWEAQDIERKVGFPGSKYTGTSTLLTFIAGALLSVLFYVAMSSFSEHPVAQKFLDRGPIPYVIVLFTGWCLATLFVKWRKLQLQRKPLEYSILPEEPGFVLSPMTADEILENIYVLSDNPKRFLLLNRIERALSNLKNIGRVSDVDDILRSQAENDESYMEATYTRLHGLIWAVPVLGFIGTVLGLSSAVGNFGNVLGQAAEINALRGALQEVTGGLSVAFDTTLVGLVAAVGIQLLLTHVKRDEELFLDECNEYCHRHIVSKLRTITVEEEKQIEGAP